MKTPRIVISAAMALTLTTFVIQGDLASFPRYNDGCQKCHGAFTDTFSTKADNIWPDTKHNVHRRDMLDSVCDACHLDGDDRNPFLNMSNGTVDLPGIGCLGCHGNYYENEAADLGAGLRAHHFAEGLTFCASCHFDDPPPLPERILPEYYGKPTVNVLDPCNQDGSENWTSDGEGLDNDGDLDYDGDDRDCADPPPMDQDRLQASF